MNSSAQVATMKIRRTRRLVTAFALSAVGLLAALALSTPASADGVPPLFPVQGLLAAADGTLVDGPHDVVLRLHGQAEGGTPIYEETHADLEVQSGSFLAYLGGGTPSGAALAPGVFEAHQDLWLEVTVDGEVITPRFRYGTVPYSAVAGKSEDSALLAGQVASHYRYAAGAGLALTASPNVFSVADRGVTSEKLAENLTINAQRLTVTQTSTLASATLSGALNVTGATTLAATTASTLSTTGKATLASADVTGALDVNGATTLASTTATTLATTGAATLASANVSGALSVTGATTLSTASAIFMATSGNLDVGGFAFLGLTSKECTETTTCTCDDSKTAVGGGAEGTATRIPYLAHPTLGVAFKAECTNSTANRCPKVHVLCARIRD